MREKQCQKVVYLLGHFFLPFILLEVQIRVHKENGKILIYLEICSFQNFLLQWREHPRIPWKVIEHSRAFYSSGANVLEQKRLFRKEKEQPRTFCSTERTFYSTGRSFYSTERMSQNILVKKEQSRTFCSTERRFQNILKEYLHSFQIVPFHSWIEHSRWEQRYIRDKKEGQILSEIKEEK